MIPELVVVRDEFSVLAWMEPKGPVQRMLECQRRKSGNPSRNPTVYVEYTGVGNPDTDGKPNRLVDSPIQTGLSWRAGNVRRVLLDPERRECVDCATAGRRKTTT